MPSVTSKKLPYIAATQFKESFYEPSPEIGYVYVGKHISYADDASPDTIKDTVFDEKQVWENMIAAKRITGNDVELVIPLIEWTANTKYKQYDDVVDLDELLTGNTSLNVKPMYVFTSQRNVYKCLSNNASANSTVEPAGDYAFSNGNIATSDGYLWKYMYNVQPSNKFLTDEWIPVPSSTSQLDYGTNDLGIIDGELTTVVVTNTGSGYYENNVAVVPIFATGCTQLSLINVNFVAANMFVSGTGITPGTYITAIDAPVNNITLSLATSGGGGGGTTANQISLKTRIYVDGNGTGAVAVATVNSSQQLEKVSVTTIGTNYSRANAYVYGTGTGATLRVIRDMKYGHAKNPAKELGANSVMIVSRIGEIDSTENGKIPADTTFRQYGVFVNPHKYGSSNVVSVANATSVISQATIIEVTSGTSYTLGELAYQGVFGDLSVSSTTAYGFVLDQTSSTVRLTNVIGTFKTGAPLLGASSGVQDRLVVSIQDPEFEPYSGDVLYAENALKTQRADGQAENIKLIVRF